MQQPNPSLRYGPVVGCASLSLCSAGPFHRRTVDLKKVSDPLRLIFPPAINPIPAQGPETSGFSLFCKYFLFQRNLTPTAKTLSETLMPFLSTQFSSQRFEAPITRKTSSRNPENQSQPGLKSDVFLPRDQPQNSVTDNFKTCCGNPRKHTEKILET